MPAAYFDLDKTLTTGSTVMALTGPMWRAGLLRTPAVARVAVERMRFTYGVADHQTSERLRRAAAQVVAGWPVELVQRVVREAGPTAIDPIVYPLARRCLAEHRARGDRLVLVTASTIEMAELVGDLLGLDDAIGSTMQVRDGRYTGRVDDYVYGARKAEVITRHAADHGFDLADCSAYSDSATDVPMLEAVGHPVAANPDVALRRVAVERGWRIVSFAAGSARRSPSRARPVRRPASRRPGRER